MALYKNISKEYMEALGLHIGSKLTYKRNVVNKKGVVCRVISKRCTVCAMYKHYVIVKWEGKEWNECFSYELFQKNSLKLRQEGFFLHK